MKDISLIWFLVGFSEFVSLYLAYKVVTGNDYPVFKVIRFFLVFIPLLGPIFYLFTGVPPHRMHPNLRDKPNDTNYVDMGRQPNYLHKWEEEKPLLQAKIRRLEAKLKQTGDKK